MKQILYHWMGNSPMANVRKNILNKAGQHSSFGHILQVNVWREVKITHRTICDNIKDCIK